MFNERVNRNKLKKKQQISKSFNMKIHIDNFKLHKNYKYNKMKYFTFYLTIHEQLQ